MSYEDIKKTERAWAAEVANDLNNSSDKYVVYRESRPITDIKNMLQTSVELPQTMLRLCRNSQKMSHIRA